MPCWWGLTRPKQLSMAATARVIWLYTCVRYWPDRGFEFECVTSFYCFKNGGPLDSWPEYHLASQCDLSSRHLKAKQPKQTIQLIHARRQKQRETNKKNQQINDWQSLAQKFLESCLDGWHWQSHTYTVYRNITTAYMKTGSLRV